MSSRLKLLSATALLALGGCAHDYVGMCASNREGGVWSAKVMSAVYTNDTQQQSKITHVAEATVPPIAVTPPPPTDQKATALDPAPAPIPPIAVTLPPPTDEKATALNPTPIPPITVTPPPPTDQRVTALNSTPTPPSPEVIAMCGTDKDCQGGVTRLLTDPARIWIKSGGTDEGYRTGVRVLAFRLLRPQLDCDELAQGIHETEAMIAGRAGTEAPDSSEPKTEKKLQGVQLLARAVKVELEAEYKRRCKRAASAPDLRPFLPPLRGRVLD